MLAPAPNTVQDQLVARRAEPFEPRFRDLQGLAFRRRPTREKSGVVGQVSSPEDRNRGVDLKRLLVVDDDSAIREILRRIGERRDFAVETLGDSTAFESVYRAFEPSLIILDIVMPQVDGIEIARWLAANGNRSPVILVTGYSPEFARAAELVATAKGRFPIRTVVKPFECDEIEAALTALS